MSCQLGRQGATARQPRRVALHVLERDGLLAEESRVVLLADEKVIAQGIDQRDQHLRELRADGAQLSQPLTHSTTSRRMSNLRTCAARPIAICWRRNASSGAWVQIDAAMPSDKASFAEASRAAVAITAMLWAN